MKPRTVEIAVSGAEREWWTISKSPARLTGLRVEGGEAVIHLFDAASIEEAEGAEPEMALVSNFRNRAGRYFERGIVARAWPGFEGVMQIQNAGEN